jgi:hypothetical protein
MRLKWKLVSVHLEIVAILSQERCTVHAEHTIGSDIIFNAPDGTSRWCGSYGISCRPIWRQCQFRCKIGARFVPNLPYAQKSFWTHPIELLGDVGYVESCFSLFGDTISVGARQGHGFCQTYHRLKNHFGCTRWYSQVTRVKWKLILVCLEIVLILMQYRCTVCAERTISSKIILGAPDGTLRWHGSFGISFWSVWRQC